MISLGSLVAPDEIAARLGVDATTIPTWRRRYPSFPAPVATFARVPVWQWEVIRAWCVTHGRADSLPDANYAEVAKLRRAILGAIDNEVLYSDAATLVLSEQLSEPRDYKVSPRGAEWEPWRDLSIAERRRLCRSSYTERYCGSPPDVLADRAGLDVDTWWETWIRGTRELAWSDFLRRRYVPRDPVQFSGVGPCELWPELAREYGDIAAIFQPGAGAYIATVTDEIETDGAARPLVCTYGLPVTELEYEEWQDEVLTLELAAEGIDRAAEWLEAADACTLGRLSELIPSDVRDQLPSSTPLEDVYVAVYAAYLAHELV